MKGVKEPIIFVTGIGQTWSMLKDSGEDWWNIVPDSRSVIFKDAGIGDYFRLGALGVRAVFSCLTGAKTVDTGRINKVLEFVLRYCIADENGELPENVDVKIYGARNFRELENIDFVTGGYTGTPSRSMLSRVYKDIPCAELAEKYGAENMYCFNYSPFSDIYSNAEKLRDMIKQVLSRHPQAQKAVLIPMSMGATVVNAYLDRYYDENGSVGESLVSKVISIVGAWDGSDGLADVLCFKATDEFYSMLHGDNAKTSTDKIFSHLNRQAVDRLVRQCIDSVTETLLLKTSSFIALIPHERFDEVSEILFTADRMKDNARLSKIKAEAERYCLAQTNMKERFYSIQKKCGVGFSFISGYGMKFGGSKSDFSFLSLFESADKTNSDTVIQISSTAPGTSFVPASETIINTDEKKSVCKNKKHNHVSPDLSVDASTAFFPENSWYFKGQEHELGQNNTALKLAIGIANNEITDVHNPKFPQFNSSRDIRMARALLKKAESVLSHGIEDKKKSEQIASAADEVRKMLERTLNDRENDDKLTLKLAEILDGE